MVSSNVVVVVVVEEETRKGFDIVVVTINLEQQWSVFQHEWVQHNSPARLKFTYYLNKVLDHHLGFFLQQL